jgi:hypothetical protein
MLMKANKKFKLRAVSALIDPMGGCIATGKITIDEEMVNYMFRDEPGFEKDSGWRFFSRTEDQEYVDDPGNMRVYDVNTIANFDKTIIPYLKLPVGTGLERVKGTDLFHLIPG